MIVLKSQTDLTAMRRSGEAAAQALQTVVAAVRPGVTTAELDRIAEAEIRRLGGVPSFLGYRGFPASICASVNDQVVHGIPGPRELHDGEVVSVDLGVVLDGFHGDLAVTVAVGEVSEAVTRLLRVTAEALQVGIRAIRPDGHLGDVSAAIQQHVERHGYTVVREFAGHGIGRRLHEEPQVPNFGRPGNGVVLRPGMTLAIEPMVNMGSAEVVMDPDGWTVRTQDRKPSAHFEHTVAVGEDGPIILTGLPVGGPV
ncbi:MAG TPA: type I methionyl aminopeptidase [bacterium]|nr:type I methionyl aminopeptidase [bacterium]